MKTNSANSNLLFLIDTEASVSLIKISAIKQNIPYDKNDIIKLTGISKTPIFSLGSFQIKITEQNEEFIHKCHIVSDDICIPSHGIIGKDFLKRFHCLVDYGDMSLTIRKQNCESVKMPIKSELLDGVSAVPPRSETFKIFHIKSEKFPCLIETQEVEEGVIVPTTLVHEPASWLRVLNTNESIKIINTNKIKSSNLNDFNVIQPQKYQQTHTTRRTQKLQSILRKKVPEFMREKMIDLATEFADIFHVDGDKFTTNNFYEQKITLTDNIPVYSRNYKTPHFQKKEMDSQTKVLLENDLIELSTSPYNSPLIIVPKKSLDGKPKYRMCIDYRKLNKKIIPDKFPLPRIEEILEGLGRAKYFSIMDLNSGFHQIPLAQESRPPTAFSTDTGFYQWKVVPFGINIAPSSFSRMMSIAFSGLAPNQAFIYMDDLIVIGITENQHINNLRSVFQMCRQHNLKLNPEKCDFFKSEVIFLGHCCTSDGLKPNPTKIATINNYPTPTNKDETTRFHAMANYYRRFIRNFSTISHPLTYLRKKRVPFKWTPECENAFQQIKNALVSSPILSYPDFTKQFKVTVDASQLGCGAVISQEFDGCDLPISFISRTFKKGELNKAIIEKELIAIHFALKTFRHYLYGQKFTVFSDHKPLIYLFKLKNPSSKLMRIKMDLEEYDFTIEYIKGRDNVVADALSRISIQDLFKMYEENNVFKVDIQSQSHKSSQIKSKIEKHRQSNQILAFTRSMTRKQLQNEQPQGTQNTENIENIPHETPQAYESLTQSKQIPRVRITNAKIDKHNCFSQITLNAFQNHKKIFQFTLDNEKVTLNELLSTLQCEARKFNLKIIEWPLHDIVFQMCTIEQFKNASNNILKHLQIRLIQTPTTIDNKIERENILNKFHTDELYGGHCGSKKLYAKIKEQFFWRNMTRDISNYIKNCHVCKLSKPNPRTREPLELTETPLKPFDLLQIDTIGPLPKSNSGNIYAITIIDEMSKFLVIIPIANKSAKEVAKAIFEKYILTFGPMKSIKSDMGTEFKNSVISEICKLFKIEHKISTAYHHETVGAIERSHRVLNEYLREFLDGKLDEWDVYAHYFQFFYNTTKHDGLKNKYSPYEIVFLRRNLMPHEILNSNVEPLYNVDDYVKECKLKMQIIHAETVQLIQKVKQTNKNFYDKKLNPIKLKVGDLIKVVKEPYDKFKYIYDGPYEVKNLKGKNIEIVLENGKLYTIHKNRVIKY